MTVEQIRRKEQRFQLVDVRSASAFAAGHIPGTVNVPMEQVEKRLADFNLDEPVVLVCKSGTRARIVRDLLGAKVPNVSVLYGGTDAWAKGGLPLVHCRKARWSLERQVRLGAGVLILASVELAVWVNLAWLGLTAFVTVEHLGAGRFEIKPRGHRGVSDQPAESGGPDEGMTPPEFLLAALGSCAAYYAAEYLKARKLAGAGNEGALQHDPRGVCLAVLVWRDCL